MNSEGVTIFTEDALYIDIYDIKKQRLIKEGKPYRCFGNFISKAQQQSDFAGQSSQHIWKQVNTNISGNVEDQAQILSEKLCPNMEASGQAGVAQAQRQAN